MADGEPPRAAHTQAATPVEASAARYIAADVAQTALDGRAWKVPAVRDSRSGQRTALLATAALVGGLVVVGGVVAATGLLGSGAQTGSGATAPVAAASEAVGSTPPARSTSATPRASAPPIATEPQAVGGSFDSLTDIGLWPARQPSRLDATGDLIYSVPTEAPGHQPDYVDILDTGAAIVDASQEVVDAAFNASTFDCNIPTDIRTFCITQADIPPGPILIVASKHAELVPEQPAEGLVIYSLVLDSDGDPANDFEASAPFTWDFYQGTDRWYELVYTPDLGWYLTVDRGETPSDARVAIWGDHVIFFVPMTELATEAPGFRTAAFASTDASYAPQTSGGDVAPGPPEDEWDLAEPTR